MESHRDASDIVRLENALRNLECQSVQTTSGVFQLQFPGEGLFTGGRIQLKDEWVTFGATGADRGVGRSKRRPVQRPASSRTECSTNLWPYLLAITSRLPGGAKLAWDEQRLAVQLSAELPRQSDFEAEDRLAEWVGARRIAQASLHDVDGQIRRNESSVEPQLDAERPECGSNSAIEEVDMGSGSQGSGSHSLSEAWLSVARSCGWPTTRHDPAQVDFKLDHGGSHVAVLAPSSDSQVRLSVALPAAAQDAGVVRQARRRLLLRANRVIRMVRAVESISGRFRWEYVWSTQTPYERELTEALGSLAVAVGMTAEVCACLADPAVAGEYVRSLDAGRYGRPVGVST